MPNINITEKEDVSLASFDASENVVLIPLLYCVDDITATVPEAKKYTSISEFKEDFSENRLVIDNSYVMAYELLLQGLTVVIKPIKIYSGEYGSEGPTESEAFKKVETAIVDNGAYEEFKSKNIYNIKFVTSGAWPNCGKPFESSTTLYTKLAEIAQSRGDAIALVEFKKAFESEKALLKEIIGYQNSSDLYSYSACNFPWATYTTSVKNVNETYLYTLPGCFAYLMAYSESVKTNANWFAAAGVIRGEIPGLESVNFEVNEALMHILQGDNSVDIDGVSYTIRNKINVIYNAGVYGHILWGNKVFWSPSSSAKDMFKEYLNVRILMCDVKKQIYHAAMRTTFEPNDDITWLNFKSLSNTLLDKMRSGRGIKWYKWVRINTEAKGTIKAQLTIQPIEAVESFDINIYLTDEDASVTE